MNKTIKHILLGGLLSFALATQALELKQDAPTTYQVKAGDTLWAISKLYTDDPWQWPQIWYLNDQISNPHLIFPGDIISLVTVDGQTKVTLSQRGIASRTVKLQPNARIEPIESAIPAIPQDAIRSFIMANRIVDTSELDNAPRIIAAKDSRIMLGTGDIAYARGFKDLSNVATSYGIYRRGKQYRDPKTKEQLGYEAIEIGQVQAQRLNDDILEVKIERSNQQVMAGDLLLAKASESLVTAYLPKAPSQAQSGFILDANGNMRHLGQYDVVTLNLGSRDNLEVGNVLVINKQGNVVYDRVAGEKVRLPASEAAQLMVFKTFEKLSFALIMSATQPFKVGDSVTSPK